MPQSMSEEQLLLSLGEHELAGEPHEEKLLKRINPRKSSRCTTAFFTSALGISIVINIVLALGYALESAAVRPAVSPLAHLVEDRIAVFATPSDYGNDANITNTDELWASTHTDVGMVALPKSPALHPTETFPWDSTKGVYMLNGYHGLHCLKTLYTSFRQYELSIPQTQPSKHIVHCIGALHSDIICAADDTPRFINGPVPGDNFEQMRTCRDWTRLERWAKDHSACFKRLKIRDPRYESLHEWKSCPEDSPYKSIVEEYFRNEAEVEAR